MTTPVPALSTSADVEAVASALLASRLTWGVHTDRWGDQEWQREFWTEAATIAVAALSTPPTEGTIHQRGLEVASAYQAGLADARRQTSVPGVIGAGSVVEALESGQPAGENEGHAVTPVWTACDQGAPRRQTPADVWDEALRWVRQQAEVTSPEYVLDKIDQAEPFNPYRAIAQDADRTSRGGALGEALTEGEISTLVSIIVRYDNDDEDVFEWHPCVGCPAGEGPCACSGRPWLNDEMTAAINAILAARAARPAPDDQAEGER